MPDEFERIMREQKEEQEQDLLMDIARADNQTQNAIEEEEATARINNGQPGQDINTGGGGSGRKPGRPSEGKLASEHPSEKVGEEIRKLYSWNNENDKLINN